MVVEAYLLCHSSYKPWQIVRIFRNNRFSRSMACKKEAALITGVASLFYFSLFGQKFISPSRT